MSHETSSFLPSFLPSFLTLVFCSTLSLPAAAEITVANGVIRVGRTNKVVLSHSAGDFDEGATVEVDPVASLQDVTLVDGDLHCIITGVSPGTGTIKVEDGDTGGTVTPGVICYRDVAELGAILDTLLAAKMAELGPPASGALHGARVLVAELLRKGTSAGVQAVLSLVEAAKNKIRRAETLSGQRLTLLLFIIRKLGDGIFGFVDVPAGHCELHEEVSDRPGIPPILNFAEDVKENEKAKLTGLADQMARDLDAQALVESNMALGEEVVEGDRTYRLVSPGTVVGVAAGPAVFGISNAASNIFEYLILVTPQRIRRSTQSASGGPVLASFAASDPPRPGYDLVLSVSGGGTAGTTATVKWGWLIVAQGFANSAALDPYEMLDAWDIHADPGSPIVSSTEARNHLDMTINVQGTPRGHLLHNSDTTLEYPLPGLGKRELFDPEPQHRVAVSPRVTEEVHKSYRGDFRDEILRMNIETALDLTARSTGASHAIVQNGSLVVVVAWAICYGQDEEERYFSCRLVRTGGFSAGLYTESLDSFSGLSNSVNKMLNKELTLQRYLYTRDHGELNDTIADIESGEVENETGLDVEDLKDIHKEVLQAELDDPNIHPEPPGASTADIEEVIDKALNDTMTKFDQEYWKDLPARYKKFKKGFGQGK